MYPLLAGGRWGRVKGGSMGWETGKGWGEGGILGVVRGWGWGWG